VQAAGHGLARGRLANRNVSLTWREEDFPKLYFLLRLTPQDCLPETEWRISVVVRKTSDVGLVLLSLF
jgi:hypothetical protein